MTAFNSPFIAPVFDQARRLARGFRSFCTSRVMVLLKAGNLDLHLPRLLPA